MPELPEVETIRRQLEKKIIGKKLNKQKIVKVRRRAKLLIIDFADKSSLLLHLKLTGQLIFNGKPSTHTRHIFKLSDGSRLIFNDVRKFGWWKKVKETKKIESKFGPEPLEMDFKTFKNLLNKRPNTEIKPLLMDQKFIAGIGNIYSDEILYAAKVHPLRRAKTLNNKKIREIFRQIKKILTAAIKHQGSSVEYYRNIFNKEGKFIRYHKVYQKQGQKCSRCKAIIKRIKISGRSAHFCSRCQRIE